VGGVLVDRFGSSRVMLWTTSVCLAGAALTAFSPDFTAMAAGRLLFGIGAETFNISTLAAIAQYFTGRNLALAMGLNLAISRAGSFSADMSPSWFARAYAQGWQPPLIIAAVFAATSFAAAVIYWLIDRRARGNTAAAEPAASQRFAFRDLLRFKTAYWFLLVLCVLWYAVILAFRSTFSIKYFQHAHGLSLATAGAMNSYVFLAAIFATPAFGWLCDRIGRYAPMLAFGALLLPIAIAIMALTHWSLWVATVLIGVSFSLVPAVMWPLEQAGIPGALRYRARLDVGGAERRHCWRQFSGWVAQRQRRRECLEPSGLPADDGLFRRDEHAGFRIRIIAVAHRGKKAP
jgi:MFS family permease